VNMNDQFIDGVGQVSSQGGLVRVELLQTKSLGAKKAKGDDLQVSERLTMTLDTFLRMYAIMGNIAGQMETKGIIKKKVPAKK
jgi:hypothetical protein